LHLSECKESKKSIGVKEATIVRELEISENRDGGWVETYLSHEFPANSAVFIRFFLLLIKKEVVL
jgi:hypothetical protein